MAPCALSAPPLAYQEGQRKSEGEVLGNDSQSHYCRWLYREEAEHAQTAFVKLFHLVAEDLPVDRQPRALHRGERVQYVKISVHDKRPQRPAQLLVDKDAVIGIYPRSHDGFPKLGDGEAGECIPGDESHLLNLCKARLETVIYVFCAMRVS